MKYLPPKPPRLLFALIGTLCLAQSTSSVSFTISTVAGNATAGFAGDTGAAINAELNLPTSIAVAGGSLYIADQANNRIRAVGTNGNITTLAGNGTAGLLGDSGTKATDAEINSPYGIAVDTKGNVYFSDTVNNLIRKVNGGIITTVAGLSGELSNPAGLAVDSSGNVYIADAGNQAIEKLTVSGTTYTMTRIAGNGTAGFTGTGGPAKSAQLNNPLAIAISPSGDLYIADTNNSVIRKVAGASPNGTITIVAGGGTLTSDGAVATLSKLNYPKGVVLDSASNLYIADTFDQKVRMVAANGNIYTVAGNGTRGFSGDGGAATSAQLIYPEGLAIDSSGNIYVADTQNSVIRLLTVSGSGTGLGKPTIGGIQTAGTFGAFNSSAPGSWIEIYGSNLAADTREWSGTDFNGANAPTALDRTTVQVSNAAAFVRYVSPGQVNVQVPNVPAGPQQITVTTAVGTSAPYTLQINTVQPGIFAPPAVLIGGQQYAGALFPDGNWVLPTGAVSGITSHPARAGDTIVLYGVGFGNVTSGIPPGQIAQGSNSLALPVTMQVLFGQTPGILSYWGLAPGAVGLYQFNVVVPAGAGTGAVPLSFALNNVNGGTVTGSQKLYIALQ